MCNNHSCYSCALPYKVLMPGERPQVFRLFGEIAEPLRGKAWLLGKVPPDPLAWVESFFDVAFELEVTPDAYALLGPGSTLMNVELHAEQVPEPTAAGLLLLGGLSVLARRRRTGRAA